MSRDVKCPYCAKWQEINHDDSYGYTENETFEQKCYYCEKNFAYTTSLHFYYEAEKADCLNGGEHKYKPTHTYPKKCTKMRCLDCNKTRSCNDKEMAQVINT